IRAGSTADESGTGRRPSGESRACPPDGLPGGWRGAAARGRAELPEDGVEVVLLLLATLAQKGLVLPALRLESPGGSGVRLAQPGVRGLQLREAAGRLARPL